MANGVAPPEAPGKRVISPAERVALQQAGQYAGLRDLTPENAESVGLDPERGFVGRGAPTDTEAKPGQTWNPAPILKQILETPVPGVPPLWQSSTQETPGWNPSPIVGQILKTQVAPKAKATTAPDIPGAVLVKPDTAEPKKAPEQAEPEKAPDIPGAVLVKSADAEQKKAPEQAAPEQIPGATLVKPESATVPAPPPSTGQPPLPQGQPSQQPVTVTGGTPAPPKPEEPTSEQPAVPPELPVAPKPTVVAVLGGEPKAVQQAPRTTPPLDTTQKTTATEFGYVDRAAVAAHPEQYPSGNKGFPDFGTVDLSGEHQKGVSLPPEDINARMGRNVMTRDRNGVWHADPDFAADVRSGRVQIEVTNPATGKTAMAPLVDIGPNKAKTGAGLDVLHGTAEDLGFTSGKGTLHYRIAGAGPSQGVPLKQPKTIAEAAVSNVGHLNTTQDPGTNGGELACADAVCRIVRNQMGIDLPKTLSTADLYGNMRKGGWKEVNPNTPGAIIISPARGDTHGHVGIVGPDGKTVYSNSSRTGNWEANYTTDKWAKYFGGKGLEVHAFVPGPNVGHLTAAQLVAERDAESSGGGDKGAPTGPAGPTPVSQPMISIPSAGGGYSPPGGPSPQGGGWSGDGGGGGGGGGTISRAADIGSIGIPAMIGAAALGSLLSGRGGQQRPAPAEEEPSAVVQALIKRGYTPAEAASFAQKSQAIIPHEPLQPPPAPGGQKPALPAPSLALPAPGGPPAAPGGVEKAQAGLADALKALQSLGVKKGEAQAMLKGATGTTAAELVQSALKSRQQAKGGAIPKPRPGQPPPAAPGARPGQQLALPSARPGQLPPAAVPPARTAQVPPQAAPSQQPPEVIAEGIRPAGSTHGVANPPTRASLVALLGGGAGGLAQAQKQHAETLSPDDPRVKKQADNYTKGEHFVPGDELHEHYLSGLPGGQGGRHRQILGEGEQAIAEKRPMHVSYISSPKEAEQFPTRESRTTQYEAHTPQAREEGITEGQLVGHTMIPVSVGITMPKGKGAGYRSVINGLSTNVMANNFNHIVDKMATMGRRAPYEQLDDRFFNALEGYLHNLNAGHTATGRGYQLGTEAYPNEPDLSHVPHRLTRAETDFINLAINNQAAFSKNEQGQALRELARANGTLITEAGETNRLRHEIEQQDPGWALPREGRKARVLEPSIKTFRTGLIHEIHPTVEHMPEAIRPGREYQALAEAFGRTSERGRPDVPIAASLHHNFQHNKEINRVERDFSEGRISEADARARLHQLGEDPDAYRYVSGSGGLITPYEENPEAITQGEHDQLKNNLRQQWIGGKLDVENYRRKAAEVPLPELASRKPTPASAEEAKAPVSVAKPAKPKPPAALPSTHEPMPGEEEKPEEPETPHPPPTPKPVAKPPKKAPVAPLAAPEAPPKVKTPETQEPEPETPVEAAPPPAKKPSKPREESQPTPSEPPEAPGAREEPETPKAPAKVKKVSAPAEALVSKPKDWKGATEQERQAYLEQKVAGTLADQYRGKETHELKVQRKEDGGIKYDPQGSPIYEKHDYDIANSPLLKKKALGEIEGADEHEDTIGDLIGPDGKPVIDPETGQPVKQHAHLKQVERRRLSAMRTKSAVATLGDKIVESYQKLQGMPEIMAGKGWYSRMRKRLAEHLGEHHELFAQLLGATSAKTPVRTNFIQALDALEQLRAGKFDKHIKKYQEAYDQLKQGKGALSRYMKEQGIQPFDKDGNPIDAHESDADAMAHWIAHHEILPLQKNGSKYNANSEAVLKVLAGTWLKEVGAPKTPNFAGNLTGRTLEATIDVWAARHLQRLGYEGLTKGKPWRAQVAAEPGVNGLDFAFSQDAMRHAADKLGINPDDLQAVLWFAEKHHYEAKGWTRGQGAEKGSFDETADLAFPKSGEPMTSEQIKDHYNKVRLAHKALEYESHPKEFMRKKLPAYLEKHGIEHHHLEAARAEGAEPEETD